VKIAHQDQSEILKFLQLLSDHLASQKNSFDTTTLDISVGSTPTMFSHQKMDIPNKLDLHPGNYVFFDRQQLYSKACEDEDSIAGFVLARVIAQYKDAARNAIMVNAGATALT
jgi:D-serine deaminase-like pyridoxal phosphate-dependent protein